MPNDANILQPTFNPMDLDPIKARQLEQGVNQGVIAPTAEELSKAAGLDMSAFPVLSDDGNWDPFISDLDPQYDPNFDSLGCNIFSGCHLSESYINALGGDPDYMDNGHTEFSERDACVAAGLDGSGGSSEAQWENMVNTWGFVKGSLWPFLQTMTRNQFFAKPVPSGKSFLDKYQPFHRSVGTDVASLKEALKYGPVKLFIGTGSGWNQGEPNVIPRTNNPMNHAVYLRRIDDLGLHIYDQYPPFLKVLAPNYIIFYAFQTFFKKKGQSMAFTVPFDVKRVTIQGEQGIFLAAPNPQVDQELCSAWGKDVNHFDINIPKT